jgi:hypothetical protein
VLWKPVFGLGVVEYRECFGGCFTCVGLPANAGTELQVQLQVETQIDTALQLIT